MGMRFEWDAEKAASNLQKHGVSFEEAVSAAADPLALTIPDLLHSEYERRFVLMGMSMRSRILVVVHTERASAIRIISARLATLREKRDYEAGNII